MPAPPDNAAVTLWMSDLLGAGQTDASVQTLATPVVTVEADAPVTALDGMFRADPALTCIAVRPPASAAPTARASTAGALTAGASTPGASTGGERPAGVAAQWGLLTRARFQQLMTGRLGYGRLLLARKTARAVADWSPLVVDSATDVADVARAVVEHGSVQEGAPAGLEPSSVASSPVTDLLVVKEGQDGQDVSRVSVSSVFRALSAQLAVQALTDPLTRLANRDHFLQFLHRCCREARAGERLAVVYIDLDGFKAFNDNYGHSVGDRVLQVVADRLRGSCRPQDLPARLGGDEFAVVVRLPDQAPVEQAAQGLAQRILACLGGTVTVGHLVLPGRASVGVAVAADLPGTPGRPNPSSSSATRPATRPAARSAEESDVFAQADVLLREADLAMYQAKVAGGHRAHVVTGVHHRSGRDASPIDRRELHRALQAEEFVLFYQPITEVGSGQLASVEALVRWRHPTRGLLGPGDFLDAVADAGFAAELDRHVLRTALGQLQEWTRQWGTSAPPFVNVNLSVQGLQAPGLADTVLLAVRETGAAAHRLRLEVPEAATVQHLHAAAHELAQLRRAGVRLTLDDLGAGASTLHHLTDLALDGMKIDRRFVASVLEDERDAAVVRMLLELGLSTGLAVTAEGVETAPQLQALRDMARGRSVFVQGFLLGRPTPVEGFPLPWPAGVFSAPVGRDRDGVAGS